MPNPFANSLTIEWTVPILAIRPGETHDRPTGFAAEFDCELNIAWWALGNDEFDYELDYVAFNYPRDRFIVTKETDAPLYALIERGFKAETHTDKHTLHQRIIERIHEALSDNIYAREAAE